MTSRFDKRSDPYRVLGLAQGASMEDVRENKRLLLKWLHPDRNPRPAEWAHLARVIEAAEAIESGSAPDFQMGDAPIRLPKTIDFTVDYLRSGLPRDAYARATINRSGRRYASVHVEGWQDNRSRLFAQATGHFLMPSSNG